MNPKSGILKFLLTLLFISIFVSCNNYFKTSSTINISLPYGPQNTSTQCRQETSDSGVTVYNFEIECISPENPDNNYTATGKSGESVVIEVVPGFYEISCRAYDASGELKYEGFASAEVADQEKVNVSILMKRVNQEIIEPEPETVEFTVSVEVQNVPENPCGNSHDYGFINYDPEEKIQIPEGKMLFMVSQDDEVRVKSYEWYFDGKKLEADGDYVLIDEASVDFYEQGTYILECIIELEDECIVDVKAIIEVSAPVYV